jgi:hypothetical protein
MLARALQTPQAQGEGGPDGAEVVRDSKQQAMRDFSIPRFSREAVMESLNEAPAERVHDMSLSHGAGLLIVGAGAEGSQGIAGEGSNVAGDAYSTDYTYSTIIPTVTPRLLYCYCRLLHVIILQVIILYLRGHHSDRHAQVPVALLLTDMGSDPHR